MGALLVDPQEAAELLPDDRVWTVEEYLAAVDAGVFDDRKVEMLDGRVYEKMTASSRHRTIVRLLHDALAPLVPDGYHIDRQEAIVLATGVPEPDVFVVRGTVLDYEHRHPNADEVPFAAEVSDTTLRRDRVTKLAAYAAAGIAVYWIVNLQHGRIEVYTNPDPATRNYPPPQHYAPGEVVPVVIAGAQVGTLPAADFIR